MNTLYKKGSVSFSLAKWLIGIVLMGLYQYWVYSSFWINTDDVTQVKQAIHASGDVVSVECVDIKKSSHIVRQKVYVQLSERSKFYFFDYGSFNRCADFNSKLEGILLSRNEGEFEKKTLLFTHERELYYPLATFDGYFFGSHPLRISVNGYDLFTFDDGVRHQIGFVMWLSLSPILGVLLILLLRWYKSGGIERLGANH